MRYYSSDRVDDEGRPLSFDIEGKKLEDVKRITTELFIKGYHLNNAKCYDYYWKEAEMFVGFLIGQEDAYVEKIETGRKNKNRLAKESADILNKKPGRTLQPWHVKDKQPGVLTAELEAELHSEESHQEGDSE